MVIEVTGSLSVVGSASIVAVPVSVWESARCRIGAVAAGLSSARAVPGPRMTGLPARSVASSQRKDLLRKGSPSVGAFGGASPDSDRHGGHDQHAGQDERDLQYRA